MRKMAREGGGESRTADWLRSSREFGPLPSGPTLAGGKLTGGPWAGGDLHGRVGPCIGEDHARGQSQLGDGPAYLAVAPCYSRRRNIASVLPCWGRVDSVGDENRTTQQGGPGSNHATRLYSGEKLSGIVCSEVGIGPATELHSRDPSASLLALAATLRYPPGSQCICPEDTARASASARGRDGVPLGRCRSLTGFIARQVWARCGMFLAGEGPDVQRTREGTAGDAVSCTAARAGRPPLSPFRHQRLHRQHSVWTRPPRPFLLHRGHPRFPRPWRPTILNPWIRSS